MNCRHAPGCRQPAVAIYHFPVGCICFRDTEQALCEQHIMKAQNNGLEMTLIQYLAEGLE